MLSFSLTISAIIIGQYKNTASRCPSCDSSCEVVIISSHVYRAWQKLTSIFHWIHRCQHATDNAGMSKHRLSLYYAYYDHTWHTLRFYSFQFQFRREVFLESVNSATVNATGREHIPISNNSIRKNILPNIQSKSFLNSFLVMFPSTTIQLEK